MDDATLIDRHGGPTKLAEKLGYEQPGGTQRTCNWKRRGIPAAVKLARQDLFGPEAIQQLDGLLPPQPSADGNSLGAGAH